jgi:signal transduction histidine kinase
MSGMPKVADFIDTHREHLIQRILEEASRLESSRGLSAYQVTNTFPEYLDTLARISRQGYREDPACTKQRLEESHIGLRLRLGYTQAEVTSEYVLLGRLLATLWEELPAEQQPAPEDAVLLFQELQDAMDQVVATFSGYSAEDRQAEKRSLRRLESVAPEALERHHPETLGPRLAPLLQVIQEGLGADGAELLLVNREGTRLVPVAATGACPPPSPEDFVPLDSPSFATQVARAEEPLHLPDASYTPLPVRDALRCSGLHSLLGQRLWPQGKLLGIVYVGVRQTRAFEPRARRFFEMLVEVFSGLLERAFLVGELRAANQRLRDAAEFEQQLIGIVSHDLRNPLNAIHLYATTLLRRRDMDERQAKALHGILNASERASRLIHDLLDFTKARLGGGLPIQRRLLDLHELTRQVVDEVRTTHPERQLQVEQHGDGQGEWDGDRVAQVLTNLLNNALAYSPPDTPVRVVTRGLDEHVELTVHNAGDPIPEALLPRLFEPMRRGAHEGDKASGSIGLGLFIVNEIVRAHGGVAAMLPPTGEMHSPAVEVRSLAGEGTTFTVRFPRREPPSGVAPR